MRGHCWKKWRGGLNGPTVGAAAIGHHAQGGQAATQGQHVVEQLEHLVHHGRGQTTAPQPAPDHTPVPGPLGLNLGGGGVSMNTL
jgi:hypothetical protein